MFMTIGEDVSDGLKIEQPYFQLDTPMTWDDDSSYVDTPGAPRIAHTTNHQWNHSLGQIITALIDAGLVVTASKSSPIPLGAPGLGLWSNTRMECGVCVSSPSGCRCSLPFLRARLEAPVSRTTHHWRLAISEGLRGLWSGRARSEVTVRLEASRPEWLTRPEGLPDAVHKVWD